MDVNGKIHIAMRSDTGLKRAHNEDSIGSRLDTGVVVLADGMGGSKAGEVASAIAVNTLLESLSTLTNEADTQALAEDTDLTHNLKSGCAAAALTCNRVIYQTAQSQPQYSGMGTTAVACIFYDNQMTYVHIGDSRIYRYRGNTLAQLTVDHTLVQELIDTGAVSVQEARCSPNKNLITRALGAELALNPDVAVVDTQVDDIYLFCSDGLHDMISDTEISEILSDNTNELEETADRLIASANDNGGVDNVSVILSKIVKPFPQRSVWYQKLAHWL